MKLTARDFPTSPPAAGKFNPFSAPRRKSYETKEFHRIFFLSFNIDWSYFLFSFILWTRKFWCGNFWKWNEPVVTEDISFNQYFVIPMYGCGWKRRKNQTNIFDSSSLNSHAWIYVFSCGTWPTSDKVIKLSYLLVGSSAWHDSIVYIIFGFSPFQHHGKLFGRESFPNRFSTERIFNVSTAAESLWIQLVDGKIMTWILWKLGS